MNVRHPSGDHHTRSGDECKRGDKKAFDAIKDFILLTRYHSHLARGFSLCLVVVAKVAPRLTHGLRESPVSQKSITFRESESQNTLQSINDWMARNRLAVEVK